MNEELMLALIEQWVPAALLTTDSAAKLVNAVLGTAVAVLARMPDLSNGDELLDPLVCASSRVNRHVIMLGGPDSFLQSNVDFRRRLAMLLPTARNNRGAFRAFKAIGGAVTGHESVVSPWVLDVYRLGDGTMDIITVDNDDRDQVVVSVQSTADLHPSVVKLMLDQAASVADDVAVEYCVNLTTFRTGINGWSDSAVDFTTDSSGAVTGLALVDGVQLVGPISASSDRTDEWVTVSLSTDGAGALKVILRGNRALDTGVVVTVEFDNLNGTIEVGSLSSGAYTSVASVAHRVGASVNVVSTVMVVASYSGATAMVKVLVDGVSSGWIDSGVMPSGNLCGVKSDGMSGTVWLIKQVESAP